MRAILTGGSLLFSNAQESTADFLARVGAHGVTHISGTPSHWRRALMSSSARLIAPEYIRLSGEIADEGILNHLAQVYPQARIAHAFATTEAGVAFDVNDGMTGFPCRLLKRTPGVEMKVENDSLRIRSPRTASRYLNELHGPLKNADGFVDTTDILDLRNERYYFVGRRDGVINVGGLKVHPEEVEEVINRHPKVRMSLVRTKKSSIIGSLVVADVVLRSAPGPESDAYSTFSRTSCCYAAKNLPPIRFRPLLISFSSWRLPIPGSSCGHAMRNVIAVALGLVDTEMTRGTKDEQCELIVQCRRG